MDLAPLRVFQHGKGTVTRLEFVQGKPRETIMRLGKGRFLAPSFQTLQEATDFCTEELRTDRSKILYVAQDDLIIGTLLDQQFQKAKRRRSSWVYAILSSVFFTAASWFTVMLAPPFSSRGANLALAAGLVALYLLLLWIQGVGNIEAAVLMTIILVLLCMLLPALKHSRQRSHKPTHAMTLLVIGFGRF